MNFEDKMEGFARTRCAFNDDELRLWMVSAKIARSETIADAVWVLRGYPSFEANLIADWLESKLNKNTQPDEVSVKLKDPSFVLPEYY